MERWKLTEQRKECLRNQAISDEQPGTVLHDFQVLLDFVGPEGVVAGGKYNLLPISGINELDRPLSRPLNLVLQRPQLRSHPYLQGSPHAAAGFGSRPRGRCGTQAKARRRPGHADAVGPAQPDRAIFQRSHWMFDVKLERVVPPGRKMKAPRILERHGRSPRQYSYS
jgi:hypothetical protein